MGRGQTALPVGGRSDAGGGEVTLAPDRRPVPPPQRPPGEQRRPGGDPAQSVEFWSTSAIRSALQGGDIDTWKRIAAALKRDPYGRTARQVEEVLEGTRPSGIAKALWEALAGAPPPVESKERAGGARHVRLLLERSGLGE